MRGNNERETTHLQCKKIKENFTDTEIHLWFALRNRRFEGIKFRRQHPIGPYIVDFVCLDKKLIIECDGSQHASNKLEDIKRDQFLKTQGFQVLRFWNHEVLSCTEDVLTIIYNSLGDTPHPSPLPQGERGFKDT